MAQLLKVFVFLLCFSDFYFLSFLFLSIFIHFINPSLPFQNADYWIEQAAVEEYCQNYGKVVELFETAFFCLAKVSLLFLTPPSLRPSLLPFPPFLSFSLSLFFSFSFPLFLSFSTSPKPIEFTKLSEPTSSE